jgi:hypothetical protein
MSPLPALPEEAGLLAARIMLSPLDAEDETGCSRVKFPVIVEILIKPEEYRPEGDVS